MKKILTLLLTIAALPAMAGQLGEWTHHFAYNALTHVIPTNKLVYGVSAGRLFSYDPTDESLEAYNTINILNDYTAITDACWNKQTQCLVIAYEDGNIDMLNTRDGSVVNNASILNETTTRSKEIRSITCHDKYAYITMGYGVIVIDTQKKELRDTYRFDVDGIFNSTWIENDSIFLINDTYMSQYEQANIIAGCLRDNLLDKNQWIGVNWRRAREIKSSTEQYMENRRIYRFFYPAQKTSTPKADTYRNCYWGEDENRLLMKYTKDDDGTYRPQWQSGRKPEGPESNNIFTIFRQDGKLWTAGRGWRTKSDSSEPGDIQIYSPTDGWTMYEKPSRETIGFNFVATSNIAIDPRDKSHVMVSAKSGLYEYRDGRFQKRWYADNSPIQAMINDKGVPSLSYQIVLGAIYDSNGKLWVLNSLSENSLTSFEQTFSNGVVTKEEWATHPHSEIDNRSHFLAQPMYDSRGRLWFIDLHYDTPEIYCYEAATDRLTTFRPTYNQDGTSLYNNSGDGFLRNINIDNSGNVWICGTKGLCYLPAAETNTATNIVHQYKIPRNDGTGLADYLLSTVDATCVIFDSAGRKYVATEGNGVYIISADNNTELENYTTSNSHIMSDNVYSLAIDEQTGTLYCATDMGLCSVLTDAIAVPSTLDKSNIRVYPNPVRPEYSGMITFEGLTVGADIKITTATGAIVHTGRSTSAMYQWDGCDSAGNRCASGVYNILMATDSGDEGCVAKVAIIK